MEIMGAVDDLAVSADGRTLATAGFDGTVRVHHLDPGTVRVFHGVTTPTTVARNGLILLRHGDGSLALGDVGTGSERALSGPRPLVWSQTGGLSADGSLAYYPDSDGSIVVVD